jgi:fructose-specific phosphotransferase system IIC component
MKASFYETKESLSPSNLIGGMIGGLATGAFAMKLLAPLIGLGVKHLVKRYK